MHKNYMDNTTTYQVWVEVPNYISKFGTPHINKRFAERCAKVLARDVISGNKKVWIEKIETQTEHIFKREY